MVKSRMLVAALVLTLSSMASAFTAPEVRSIVQAGGRLTVDQRFSALEVSGFLSAGGQRVTVIARGFTPADVRGFLAQGALLVLDATMPSADLLDIASAGRTRVTVDPQGLAPDVLRRVVTAGANLLAGTGGATYKDKLATVTNGGQAGIDASFPIRDVTNLIAVGRVRVHVKAKGFGIGELQLFTQMGAIVWVDASTPAPEISGLASSGQGRIVVRSAGFTSAMLQSFAAKGAHIVIAFDDAKAGRDAVRAAKFDQLHGE